MDRALLVQRRHLRLLLQQHLDDLRVLHRPEQRGVALGAGHLQGGVGGQEDLDGTRVVLVVVAPAIHVGTTAPAALGEILVRWCCHFIIYCSHSHNILIHVFVL